MRKYEPIRCEHCGAPKSPVPMIRHIQVAVAAYYGVSVDEMLSRRRGDAGRARQVAMYLCRELTPRSFPDIAKRFDRDHSSILQAIQALDAKCKDDWELRADIATLRQRLSPMIANDLRAVEMVG